MKIPGRVGYQCSNFYRQLIKEGKIHDDNYSFDSKGKLVFRFRDGEGKSTLVHNKKAKGESKPRKRHVAKPQPVEIAPVQEEESVLPVRKESSLNAIGLHRSHDDDAGGEACDQSVRSCDGLRFVGEGAQQEPEEHLSFYEESECRVVDSSVALDTEVVGETDQGEHKRVPQQDHQCEWSRVRTIELVSWNSTLGVDCSVAIGFRISLFLLNHFSSLHTTNLKPFAEMILLLPTNTHKS